VITSSSCKRRSTGLHRRAVHRARFRRGRDVIAITTAGHWKKIAGRLVTAGIDVAAVQAARQLVVLDAHERRARFMVDGMPDRGAMRTATIRLDAVRGDGHTKARAFGEMVDTHYRAA
jgi:hypothetical protein